MTTAKPDATAVESESCFSSEELEQFERDGLVEGEWTDSSTGQHRRYYHITLSGQDRLASMLQEWDLFTKAAEARILFGLVQTSSELLDCPQLESRNFYREVDHPVIGKVKVPAALFNLSLTPYQYIRPAPTLGQHNSEIYVDGLEYSREDFVRLRQLDVI